jgi:GWxTD domain-containing protein
MRAGSARALVLAFAVAIPLLPIGFPSAWASPEKLSVEDREWLDSFVAPIIQPDERKLFLELTERWQHEIFEEEFWKRRELSGLAFPLGPGYRHRYRELRSAADEYYDGWRSDAGRMVIRHGLPEINHLEGCDRTFRNLEIWTYAPTAAISRGPVRYLFYRKFSPQEPRRMWTTAVPQSDVFAPGACRQSFLELGKDCGKLFEPPNDPCWGQACPAACLALEAFEEISTRQGGRASGEMELAQAIAPADVSLEGLRPLRDRFAALAREGAKPIAVESAGSADKGGEPEPPPRHLVRSEELRERILALDRKSREWLDLALPILSEKELLEFLSLPESGRAGFIRRFWKTHS